MLLRDLKRLQKEMFPHEIIEILLEEIGSENDVDRELKRDEFDKLLQRAIDTQDLRCRYSEYIDVRGDSEITHIPIVAYISISSLKEWLDKIGFRPKFFFPEYEDSKPNHAPDYLDPSHPRYAPKLAAAVEAWLAVVDVRTETPKAALKRWLENNADRFGLLDKARGAGKGVIDTVASIANWKPEGGAPRTPG